jgi:SagB-type dehydrogenase family enzyme
VTDTAAETTVDAGKVDLGDLRPVDLPALNTLAGTVPVGPDDPPVKVRDLVHSALRSSALFDGATAIELGYLRPPPMFADVSGLPLTPLPAPQEQLTAALGDLLDERRSRHHFGPGPLPLDTLSTLLHHAAGVRGYQPGYNLRRFPFRRAPSAGGLAPVDIFMVANDVGGLTQGLYCYDPAGHQMARVDTGNMRGKVTEIALFSDWLFSAPAVFLLVCDMRRVEWKYGTRGYRFVHVDLGVLAQNLYLVGTALGLTTCAVAAFDDDAACAFARVDGRDRFVSLLFACGPPPERSEAS